VTSRSARFMASLYPLKWRARFGLEFQTFLESRHVAAGEVCDVIGRAMVEHVREDWRYAPMTAVLAFAAFGSEYVATGHSPVSPMEANAAVRIAWILLEAGSLAVIAWAGAAVARSLYRIGKDEIGDLILQIALPIIVPKVILPVCGVVALQVLPWRLTSGPLAALAAVFAGLAGFAVLGGIFALTKRLVADLEIPAQRKLEVFRLATSILGVSLIAAQFGFAAGAMSGAFGNTTYLAALGAIAGSCWGEAKRSGPDFEIS
jgi:hypothetical protein